MNSNWKIHTELNNLIDDKTYLVTWQDSDGHFHSPVLAYWMECDQKFFPLNSYCAFPLDVEFYCDCPPLPQDKPT